jgi:hypothetical protein
MADNEHRIDHPVDLTDPTQRHEARDVNILAVSKFGIGLILTTIASIFFVLGVFRYFEKLENAAPPPTGTGVNVDARRLPPEPRLLENEPENLQRMRGAEDQVLNNYSWADDKHTLVKLPIDRAIELLAQRGLPSRPASAIPPPDNISIPTASGLGSKMQQPGGPLAESQSK